MEAFCFTVGFSTAFKLYAESLRMSCSSPSFLRRFPAPTNLTGINGSSDDICTAPLSSLYTHTYKIFSASWKKKKCSDKESFFSMADNIVAKIFRALVESADKKFARVSYVPVYGRGPNNHFYCSLFSLSRFMLVSRLHRFPVLLYTLSCKHESWVSIAGYLMEDVPVLLSSEEVEDIKDVLSIDFKSLPSKFEEFIKWIAEVRRQEDGGQSLSQEEKGNNYLRSITIFSYTWDVWPSVGCIFMEGVSESVGFRLVSI